MPIPKRPSVQCGHCGQWARNGSLIQEVAQTILDVDAETAPGLRIFEKVDWECEYCGKTIRSNMLALPRVEARPRTAPS